MCYEMNSLRETMSQLEMRKEQHIPASFKPLGVDDVQPQFSKLDQNHMSR